MTTSGLVQLATCRRMYCSGMYHLATATASNFDEQRGLQPQCKWTGGRMGSSPMLPDKSLAEGQWHRKTPVHCQKLLGPVRVVAF